MNKEPITLRLDYPPSVNHIYGQRGKRKYLLPEVERYRTLVMISVIEQQPEFLNGVFFGKGVPLAITVYAYPPDRRVRDLDNIWKAILDSLQKAGVFANDNQMKEQHGYMRGSVKGGRVDVTIETMEK